VGKILFNLLQISAKVFRSTVFHAVFPGSLFWTKVFDHLLSTMCESKGNRKLSSRTKKLEMGAQFVQKNGNMRNSEANLFSIAAQSQVLSTPFAISTLEIP
jgi:hypothetical protein